MIKGKKVITQNIVHFCTKSLRPVWNCSIMHDDRIVIPVSLRPAVLSILHSAHQGTTGMTLTAQSSVYWPGITNDIVRIRDSCNACNQRAPTQPHLPPIKPTVLEYPFQHIVADYMDINGRCYLVYADRYSNWLGVHSGEGGTTALINILKELFTEHGIPETCATDGGPTFTSAMTQTFFSDWGIIHRLSSVANPHSNCRAEIAVKTAKRMLVNNMTPLVDFKPINSTEPSCSTGIHQIEILACHQLRCYMVAQSETSCLVCPAKHLTTEQSLTCGPLLLRNAKKH